MPKTVEEIARETGFSITTVRFVISGQAEKYRISEKTKKQIEDYVAIHGYSLNHAARSLKLKTIAEGVESEELANLLRMFHCDEIQGYWYARPMPAAAMEAFLRERADVGQAVAVPVA